MESRPPSAVEAQPTDYLGRGEVPREAPHSNALGFSLPRPKHLSNASLCHFACRRLKRMAIHVSGLHLGMRLALATPFRVPNWS